MPACLVRALWGVAMMLRAFAQTTCYTVPEGDNYCWPPVIGFNNATDWGAVVTLQPDTATYLCNCTAS
jgi:hypothetical protein